MPDPSRSAGQKRKAPQYPPQSSSNARKRQKFQDAKTIPTQTADAALSANGELNIASFIKSREYEINALDKSMKRARKNLSTRAFQQLPRHLRRRTASHNAKKVPKRLRARARKEMIEDNTPTVVSRARKPSSRLRLRLENAKALGALNRKRKTVRQKKREAQSNAKETDPSKHVDVVQIPRIKKNRLANPPLATSKFKRRQVTKSWLPTHLWHTKRAHMTRPIEPLWRMAIPLRPTEKSYRSTHRASGARGCIAWDMSYVSTVGCLGTERALESLLKAFNFNAYAHGGPMYKKWKAGTRFASGWMSTENQKHALAKIDVLWHVESKAEPKPAEPQSSDMQVEVDVKAKDATPGPKRRKTKLDHRILIRIHPSAFHQFWMELLRFAKMQKPQVLVEDLRFEIGSVEVQGPGSTEALTSTLQLCENDTAVQKLWPSLALLSNPALLPSNVVLSLDTYDPRLCSPVPLSPSRVNLADETKMIELATEWPLDTEFKPSALFSYKARHLATQRPSQWAINRRRQASLPGQPLEASPKDHPIPVILLAHRPCSTETNQQGTWTLLAPWKSIDLIWRKLMFCKLSAGGRPRFGGLAQTQQIAFEQCMPWYPADFPGTEAGKAWERSQAEKRFDEWIRRPPSRRLAWESLDLGLRRRGELGRGWTCDWDYLVKDSCRQTQKQRSATPVSSGLDPQPVANSQPILTQRQRKKAKAQEQAKQEVDARRRNSSSPESEDIDNIASVEGVHFTQLTPMAAKLLVQNPSSVRALSGAAVMTVRITYIDKGTPKDGARIYRLPSVASIESKSESTEPVKNSSSAQTKSTQPVKNSSIAQLSPSKTSKKQAAKLSNREELDLRSRWLSSNSLQARHNPQMQTRKDKLNHRGLPRKQHHHRAESLRSINVMPKNAPPEIHEQYGPKPLDEEEIKLLKEFELSIRAEEQKVWEKHIPCPDAADLIGFVTSGGHNLAQGRGTAIGALWIQRVLDGWSKEEEAKAADGDSQADKTGKHRLKTPQKKEDRERERHVCIVRNSGESIGRLAVWEVCD